MAPMIGLAAVVAVVLDSFAQFMFGMGDAMLAIIGLGAGCAGKKKESTKRRSSERGLAKQCPARQLFAE
jgi:hypothetical protein